MRTAIIGSGKMGSAIFRLVTGASFPATLVAIDKQEAKIHEKKFLRGLDRAVKRGTLSQEEARLKKKSTRFTHRVEELAETDLVIEAIFEDFEAKASLFRTLESVLAPEALITSNTSALSLTGLAKELRQPDRFAGLHFFHPVPLISVVEIILTPQTSQETVARLKEFSTRLKRHPITVRDAPGSVLNAILSYYYIEALYLLEEGLALPSEVDEVAKRYFYIGPCESMDVIGIDFFVKAIHSAAGPDSLLPLAESKSPGEVLSANEALGREGFHVPSLFGKLLNQGRVGKKVSLGLYAYDKDRPVDESPSFYLDPSRRPPTMPEDPNALLDKRLLYAVFNGSLFSLEKGMGSIEDLDLGVREILLMQEGPFSMMRRLGTARVREDFCWLTKTTGARFGQIDLTLLDRLE